MWLVALKSRRPGHSSERHSHCSWRSKVWLTHCADSGIFASPRSECEHAAAHTVVCEHDHDVSWSYVSLISCHTRVVGMPVVVETAYHFVDKVTVPPARCQRHGDILTLFRSFHITHPIQLHCSVSSHSNCTRIRRLIASLQDCSSSQILLRAMI